MDKFNLSEQEVLEIQKLSENTIMISALKKVLLHEVYNQGIMTDKPIEEKENFVFGLVMNEMGQDFKQTNEELGQKVRACVEGIRTIQMGFKKIDLFKKDIKLEFKQVNDAR